MISRYTPVRNDGYPHRGSESVGYHPRHLDINDLLELGYITQEC